MRQAITHPRVAVRHSIRAHRRPDSSVHDRSATKSSIHTVVEAMIHAESRIPSTCRPEGGTSRGVMLGRGIDTIEPCPPVRPGMAHNGGVTLAGRTSRGPDSVLMLKWVPISMRRGGGRAVADY